MVVVLVFGGRLPSVARDAMRMTARIRRAFDDLKREVDLDGEFRNVRNELNRTLDASPRISSPPPRTVQREPDDSVSETETDADRDPGAGAEEADEPPRETGS